ncbi:MAG: phage tail family protein [Planctomycetes bacterium]|nr:phage tail family protein [Planctomycetota bacterium]MBU1517788.1 phage tail family protein [Planctomycetota bacterium]MBU2457297.1 phage tail family protein [Planctomycetota bacterium]
MKAVLDDKVFFSETVFALEVKSPQRDIIQRSAAGLDGQVNIDLGFRGRKIVQKGELRARNQAELQKQIDEINGLIDGKLHILKCPDGRIFENLLIDEFQTGSSVTGGAHICCKYKLTYTQQG